MQATLTSATSRNSRTGLGLSILNIVVWVFQVLLAVAFALHGLMMVSPPAELVEMINAQIGVAFRLFIGVAELLAAVGLILPGITRISRGGNMTDFAYEEGRWEPPVAGDEDTTLLGFVERQRATFAWKSGNLDAAGLRATLAPSAMTLGGMLKHLARFEDDMSSEWLHGREQLPPWNAVDWSADPAWDWRTAADDSPEKLYALWRDAVVRSRALLAAAMADGGPARQSGGPDSPAPNLRYILLNMIEEYARHNGHADLIREAIDGRVGHDPPR